MSLSALQAFFGWCALVNYAILSFWAVVMLVARPQVYRVHRKWFPLSDSEIDRCVYVCIGGYKILVLVFNVVPWIVLSLIGLE